jgi:hypothetical protein
MDNIQPNVSRTMAGRGSLMVMESNNPALLDIAEAHGK